MSRLESDALCFRNTSKASARNSHSDPLCKLCGAEFESPIFTVQLCRIVDLANLLSTVPCIISEAVADSEIAYNYILSTDWFNGHMHMN